MLNPESMSLIIRAMKTKVREIYHLICGCIQDKICVTQGSMNRLINKFTTMYFFVRDTVRKVNWELRQKTTLRCSWSAGGAGT